MNHFDPGDARLGQPSGKLISQWLGSHRNNARPPTHGLRERDLEILSSRQSRYCVSLRKLLDNGKGALADRAGRTENGESFQWLKVSESEMNNLSVPQHGRSQKERVNPVQHSSVAG